MQYSILNSEIPGGGWGRPLTSTEVKALRRESGRRVSNNAIVIQAGAPHRGYLYQPDAGGMSGGTTILTTR